MGASNSSEFKKKIFSWWGLSFLLVFLGYKLAGIGGAVGGAIISYGLQKTVKNGNYSKQKKIAFSVLYCVGGMAAALIIATTLTVAVQKFFGPNVFADPNVEKNYTVPVGYERYENSKTEISSLVYPKDWIVQENNGAFEVAFVTAETRAVVAKLFLVNDGQKIDLKTYAADLETAVKKTPEVKFDKVNEQMKKIHGRDWLIFDSIVHDVNDFAVYARTAIVVTGKYDNRQYIQFSLQSDKDNFPADATIFDTMIDSVRLYQ